MKAFEVFINGHRLCLAGVGDNGMLHALVKWARGPGPGEDLSLLVGGLDRPADESLRWESPSIGVGAEVLVRVVEAATVDPPSQRTQREKQASLDVFRIQLQRLRRYLTPDERQQLLRELVAELQALDAKPRAPIT